MTRQKWYPSRIAEQLVWHGNYADKVTNYAVNNLGFTADDAAFTVSDSRWIAYVLGLWLADLRAFSLSATDYVEAALTGTAGSLPVFTAPDLPDGTTPVGAGALTRIFAFVQRFKDAPGYTTAMGQDLGIIGAENTADHPSPKFALTVGQGAGCQCVAVPFTKYTHEGVVIQSRRGTGDWESIATTTARSFTDERPLLVATQPEVREYRLRYWDKGIANGPWSEVMKATVAP